MSDNNVSSGFIDGPYGFVLDLPGEEIKKDYVDSNGIRHIYVKDVDKAWELLNTGEWVEKTPF